LATEVMLNEVVMPQSEVACPVMLPGVTGIPLLTETEIAFDVALPQTFETAHV
jgi:hypothetical protein